MTLKDLLLVMAAAFVLIWLIAPQTHKAQMRQLAEQAREWDRQELQRMIDLSVEHALRAREPRGTQ